LCGEKLDRTSKIKLSKDNKRKAPTQIGQGLADGLRPQEDVSVSQEPASSHPAYSRRLFKVKTRDVLLSLRAYVSMNMAQ
jgi:hypothetical protein